jgi:hypothetical protein
MVVVTTLGFPRVGPLEYTGGGPAPPQPFDERMMPRRRAGYCPKTHSTSAVWIASPAPAEASGWLRITTVTNVLPLAALT